MQVYCKFYPNFHKTCKIKSELMSVSTHHWCENIITVPVSCMLLICPLLHQHINFSTSAKHKNLTTYEISTKNVQKTNNREPSAGKKPVRYLHV